MTRRWRVRPRASDARRRDGGCPKGRREGDRVGFTPAICVENDLQREEQAPPLRSLTFIPQSGPPRTSVPTEFAVLSVEQNRAEINQ